MKFCGNIKIPWQRKNSAARLEILRPVENCGPQRSLIPTEVVHAREILQHTSRDYLLSFQQVGIFSFSQSQTDCSTSTHKKLFVEPQRFSAHS